MTSPSLAGDASLAAVRSARSFLFVPGDRPERFAKAAAAGADLVIVDLEDAVGAEHKAAAREAARIWLSESGMACVRVSAAGTDHHEADLAAVADATGLLAVVLAKASDPAVATAVADRCGVPVVALIESVAGMAKVAELAAAEGVARLAFGHLDYALDLGATPGRTAMLHARSTLVLASRAAGLPGPADGVTSALDDTDALATDLAHAREVGMTGKLVIHPRQVEATHAAYRPSPEEVAWAETVLAALPENTGGAVRVDGAMVDAPVLARAEDVLRRKDR